jgi:hypothetical protein
MSEAGKRCAGRAFLTSGKVQATEEGGGTATLSLFFVLELGDAWVERGGAGGAARARAAGARARAASDRFSIAIDAAFLLFLIKSLS